MKKKWFRPNVVQSIQDAIQKVLSSLLKQSPHRRVAIVTFSDEVSCKNSKQDQQTDVPNIQDPWIRSLHRLKYMVMGPGRL